MKRALYVLPLIGASLAGGCATVPPPTPLFVVAPGTGRGLTGFQQDSDVCQQHATAQTGYGAPGQPVPSAGSQAPAASTAAPGAWIASEDSAFLQCMAARGDVVTAAPAEYAAGYPGFDYGYAYPYGYFDPYPFYFGGFIGGVGWGWGHRGWGHYGWGHGGWGHGGWGHAGGGHAGGGHH